MGIAAIIVEGIVAMCIAGVIGDVITKIVKSRSKAAEAGSATAVAEVKALKERVASLEARIEERDDSVRKLQDEVHFVSRMLEDKTGGSPDR
jgi:hypothetical protein